ncbi:restriction endonuclease subunit S [Planctomicrobium sp. SH668]|uniref:restriction endonuclease subunit S n=1 Tax=Planctomicrobium sp. SH668 TaxID=3448126 RepID=UPI003F5B9194
MANNREATFQELIDEGCLEIGDGYRAKNNELGGTGPIFLRAGHVSDTHIDFAGVERFHETLRNRLGPKFAIPGDTIITTKGNSTGRTSFVTERMPEFVYSPHLSYWRSRNQKVICNGFLRYWSRGSEFISQLRGMSASTDMAPYLSLTDQRRLRISLPSIARQERIADILGTFDDKIELNRRMNETLEAMARRLFRSWFVDFDPVHAKAALRQKHPKLSNTDLSRRALPNMSPEIAELFPDGFEDSALGKIPKGWKVKLLDDLVELAIGGDWGRDSLSEEFSEAVSCIRGADIPDLQSGGLGKMPTRFLKPSSVAKRGMRVGDIAFEVSGGSPTQSTGRPVLVTQRLLKSLSGPLTCSNFCRLIRLSDPGSARFLYYYLRYLYNAEEFLQYENGTTGIKNFAFTTFCSLHPFIVGDANLLTAFDTIAAPWLTRRDDNGLEMRQQSEIRDKLLPRLLSGELATV